MPTAGMAVAAACDTYPGSHLAVLAEAEVEKEGERGLLLIAETIARHTFRWTL